MHIKYRKIAAPLAALSLLCLAPAVKADEAAKPVGSIIINAAHPGPPISPIFYGLMTEEINHSYDGGVYAELIRNRAFQDSATEAAHWSAVDDGASIVLDDSHPLTDALPRCLKVTVNKAVAGAPASAWRAGVTNSGYWGIPVLPKTAYHLSFFARADAGFRGPLTATIESTDGKTVYASGLVDGVTGDWRRYALTLKTGSIMPTETTRFVIAASTPGVFYLNLVSLFPPTYHNQPNGNRIDLMDKLAAMHPGFLRFPGGNYVEGNTIAERFDWKKTIGPLENRPGHQCPWGYRSTDGLGLLEFLEWCEDLHMQPLMAVWAGYALDGEHVTPGPGLAPYVQDALDEIEYATGDISTKWGAERARDGHPKPFVVNYVEVGNEDGFDHSKSYDGRFAQFYDAIKARYPKISLISTTHVTSRRPDLFDDHYYSSSGNMEANLSHQYNGYNRADPKVLVGEWATTEGKPTPTFGAALADASFLTGLEHNADVITMASYAPLLVNVNPGASQWPTNLIGYDALASFGSPSYYVQKMFGQNRGDVVLPVTVTPQTVAAPAPLTGAVGVGNWRTEAEFKDITVTPSGGSPIRIDTSSTKTWTPGQGQWDSSGGSLRQLSDGDNSTATAGDPTWGDYSYHVTARKTGGAEGFFIIFHGRDSKNLFMWNLGGWGDSRSTLMATIDGSSSEFGKSVPVTIDSNRWYDVRIDVAGHDIKCYLDGHLVTEASDLDATAPHPLFASASRDNKTGDIILKVVNVMAGDQQIQVNVDGASVDAHASGQVIAGDPTDQNSLADPAKVVPQPMDVNNAAPSFPHTFPGHSVTVIRLKTR